MALAGDNSEFDPAEELNAKVLEGIRTGSKPFSWGQPAKVPRVSAEEQAVQRESIEARQADAIARAQAAADAAAEASPVDVDAMFSEALTGAVEAKASEVALAPPNPHTATRADWIRHEEAVRADARAKLEAAANPVEEEQDPLVDYWAELGTDDAAEVDTDDDGDVLEEGESDVYDFWASQADGEAE